NRPLLLGNSTNRYLFRVNSGHLEWSAAKSSATPWDFSAALEFADGRLNDLFSGLTLDQIKCSLPNLTSRAGQFAASEGELSIGHVRFRTTDLAELVAKITCEPERVVFTSHWPMLENASVAADLSAALARDDSDWQFTADAIVPHAPPSLIAKFAAFNSPDIQVTGDCSAEAHLRVATREQSSTGRLKLNNVSAQSAADNYQADNISADFNFTSLVPIKSAPDQSLTVQSLSIGDFSATNVQFVASVESSSLVNISAFKAALSDGATIHSENATLNPSTGILTADIAAEGMRLRQWLPLLTHQHASGEGSISGALSLTANLKAPSFAFDRANFIADPSRGYVKIDDPSFIVQTLEQYSQFAVNDEVGQIKNRIVAALGDFEFTEFHLTSSREENKAASVLTVKGHGRQVENGEPSPVLNLTIDIPLGLDTIIRSAFSFKNMLDNSVSDEFNQFFDENQ
ncbi:MAG TPA: hypothetical protein VG711_08310, partial [Phycisphaerales bacterium]|nr:hypothetical protein [Phycisphaerales bacterium]